MRVKKVPLSRQPELYRSLNGALDRARNDGDIFSAQIEARRVFDDGQVGAMEHALSNSSRDRVSSASRRGLQAAQASSEKGFQGLMTYWRVSENIRPIFLGSRGKER